MTYQTWQKAKAAAEVAKKTYDRILKLYESEVVPAQKKDEAEANYKAMMATEQAAKAQYEMARNGGQRDLFDLSDRRRNFRAVSEGRRIGRYRGTGDGYFGFIGHVGIF